MAADYVALRARRFKELQADPGHPLHGTKTGYQYGCKCAGCKKARSDYDRRRVIKGIVVENPAPSGLIDKMRERHDLIFGLDQGWEP